MAQERWQGKCAALLSKVMNYKREGSIYGIVFYDMASEENVPDFPQVKYHVDFCVIHNRLYNGYYTHPSEF